MRLHLLQTVGSSLKLLGGGAMVEEACWVPEGRCAVKTKKDEEDEVVVRR